MANKRELKKFVRRMCGAVAGECILAIEAVNGVDEQKLSEAIVDVADLQETSLNLISFGFDKGAKEYDDKRAYHKARRAYFKKAYTKFISEFDSQLKAILTKMNEAMPKKG